MIAPRLALESTVIAHGLPHPLNLQTARELEQIARMNGVEPRTVAVLNGVPCIGLDDTQLEFLSTAPNILKFNRRDLGPAFVLEQSGATGSLKSSGMLSKLTHIWRTLNSRPARRASFRRCSIRAVVFGFWVLRWETEGSEK